MLFEWTALDILFSIFTTPKKRIDFLRSVQVAHYKVIKHARSLTQT